MEGKARMGAGGRGVVLRVFFRLCSGAFFAVFCRENRKKNRFCNGKNTPDYCFFFEEKQKNRIPPGSAAPGARTRNISASPCSGASAPTVSLVPSILNVLMAKKRYCNRFS